MPEIADYTHCSGCSACMNSCPVEAISMPADQEGFLRPSVNRRLCIECGKCTASCPVLSPYPERKNGKVWTAVNRDEEIRLASSSGGIFSLLAQKTIAKGGIVFGACFDENQEVVHSYSETMEGISVFQGSKYVQSRLGTIFQSAKNFLDDGRNVLFSGTPCQIAGLNRFLDKEYPNLTTVDIICHGVPSPAVWRNYIDGLIPAYKNMRINFRDKSIGWEEFSFTIQDAGSKAVLYTEMFRRNIFMNGFLQNLYLRPSCSCCKSKGCASGSDITLGDFWGIRNFFPDFYDNKGVSAVLLHSHKAMEILSDVDIEFNEVPYETVLKGNPALEISCAAHPNRTRFFNRFIRKNEPVSALIAHYLKPGMWVRIKQRLSNFLHDNR